MPKVHFLNASNYIEGQKVAAIKAVRTIAQVPLNEGKEMVEDAIAGKPVKVEVAQPDQDLLRGAMVDLRKTGMYLSDPAEVILNDLREVAVDAVDQGQFDLASDIINVLKKYNL